MNSLELNQSIKNSNLVELSLNETRMTTGGFGRLCRYIVGPTIFLVGAIVDIFDGDSELGDDIRGVGGAVTAFGAATEIWKNQQ